MNALHKGMRILLVEDEASVAGFIKKGLEGQHFEVVVATDGPKGLEVAAHEVFDVILLDVILPGLSGWEVCSQLRQQLQLTTPILMLTALSSTENVIKGLNQGADDYLAKPFKLEELVARILALYRRHQGLLVKTPRLIFADLEMDLDAREVLRAGEKIQLTAREFRLLEYFIKNPGKVLSRMQIMQHVWEVDFDLGTNVVDVYVNYLRKKMEKSHWPRLIHTVVGAGYILRQE